MIGHQTIAGRRWIVIAIVAVAAASVGYVCIRRPFDSPAVVAPATTILFRNHDADHFYAFAFRLSDGRYYVPTRRGLVGRFGFMHQFKLVEGVLPTEISSEYIHSEGEAVSIPADASEFVLLWRRKGEHGHLQDITACPWVATRRSINGSTQSLSFVVDVEDCLPLDGRECEAINRALDDAKVRYRDEQEREP